MHYSIMLITGWIWKVFTQGKSYHTIALMQ